MIRGLTAPSSSSFLANHHVCSLSCVWLFVIPWAIAWQSPLSMGFSRRECWLLSWHQLCLTLCDPIDGSPSGSPVPGILQARTLEWVAISFSNAWKWKVKGKSLIHVQLFTTPWTATHQAPLSMGFSRQEYWSGVPLPPLGDLPDTGIEPVSLESPALTGGLFTWEA